MGKLILNGIEYAGGPSIDDTNSSATKVYSSQKTQNLVSGTLGADVYDPTHTYATNDMCIYNNTLYKAKSSTTGNLPTDTTYWTFTTIKSELDGKQVITDASLHTTNKTITGSINELLDSLTITDITHSIGTTPSGITLVTAESAVYKQGKHIFGILLFKSINDLVVNTDNLLITTAGAYKASRNQNYFGVTSNSQYNIANACYAYISTSSGSNCQLFVKAPTSSQKYAKIQIDYVTY